MKNKSSIQETLVALRSEFTAQIIEAKDTSEIEDLRVAYLGRNGKLTLLIRDIRDLPPEMRKKLGILINATKNTLLDLIASKKSEIKDVKEDWVDHTIPGNKPTRGHLHLITQAIDEIADIFSEIGFVRSRYPEVEWDWQAFGSLNFDKNHPARDEWETFFVDTKPNPKYGPMVLTPHTSSGQIREMERTSPPIRMVNISKCYRRQSDSSHFPMFHQFEGLVIDKDISIANLKGTINYFVKKYFGSNRKTRLRPYNFPFTEPSFEIDISCDICNGKGCKLCKEGWLELAGAGMVHPNVLKNGKIDTNKYSGFAFGWGVERVLMMRTGLGIEDLRQLYSTDLRYLKQF